MKRNIRRKLVCPSCRKAVPYKEMREVPYFPFCSERCKMIDLGHWLDGQYALPGETTLGRDEPDDKNA